MTDTSTSKALVVILNYNGKDDTFTCINSLKKQSAHADILVIDNASKDGLSEEIHTQFPDVIFIKQVVNLGFAGGVNVGVKYAIEHNYKYVALLNNDATADKDWLKNLIAASQKNKSSITTGLMLNESGDYIDSAGEYFSSWGISFPGSRNNPASSSPNSSFVFGATGGGVLYETSLFQNIELFDEKFFLYFEDADISFRSQLAGYTAFYEASAILHHKRGASSDKIPGLTIYHTFKNLPLLFWKNVPTKLLLKIGSRFLLLYTLIFANAIKNGSGWPALKGIFASIWYFWTAALWKRFKIQGNKKVSADYIWSILYHDLPPEQTGMRKFRKIFTGK